MTKTKTTILEPVPNKEFNEFKIERENGDEFCVHKNVKMEEWLEEDKYYTSYWDPKDGSTKWVTQIEAVLIDIKNLLESDFQIRYNHETKEEIRFGKPEIIKEAFIHTCPEDDPACGNGYSLGNAIAQSIEKILSRHLDPNLKALQKEFEKFYTENIENNQKE